MRTISFRAKDPSEAGKRLEDALNQQGESAGAKLEHGKLQALADALGGILSAMPEGRQVVVSLSVSSGTDEEAGDGKERVTVKVATVTDRETGSLAEKHGGAGAGNFSAEISSGDENHAARQARETQDARDAEARAAQNRADTLRNTPAESEKVKPGDPVAG